MFRPFAGVSSVGFRLSSVLWKVPGLVHIHNVTQVLDLSGSAGLARSGDFLAVPEETQPLDQFRAAL